VQGVFFISQRSRGRFPLACPLLYHFNILKMKRRIVILICLYGAAFTVFTFSRCKPAGSITATGSKTFYFSPIPSIGVGPNGLPTKKINVNPFCCPSDAIEITAAGIVTEDDLQWVNIPLSLPADTIQSVRICYSSTGNAYISQTRLANMTTPDHATVVLDDATNQVSAAATCYTVPAHVKVDGTITLALKLVIPQNGSVRIGSISVSLK